MSKLLPDAALTRTQAHARQVRNEDLAVGQRTGGLGQITTDITGFRVRYAVNLLTAQRILDRAASRPE